MFLIIVGIYELSSNSAGVNCTQNPNCHPNWAILLSIYNKANDDHAMTTQQWLNVALILVMTILIQLMRRKKRLTAARCDERDISASDYTLMVENIPRESSIDHKKELKRLFEELECFADSKDNSKRVQFKVMKINLTYNLSELIKY